VATAAISAHATTTGFVEIGAIRSIARFHRKASSAWMDAHLAGRLRRPREGAIVPNVKFRNAKPTFVKQRSAFDVPPRGGFPRSAVWPLATFAGNAACKIDTRSRKLPSNGRAGRL